jgi:hypothetical protein
VNRSMIVIAMLSCALAAPLAAQQPQAVRDDSAAATAPAVAAPAPVAEPPVGPRIAETPRRIRSSLIQPSASLAYQDEGGHRSGLVYLLVVAILVVVLIILIKKA